MIDIFALALSHGLILLGLWRMLSREDFDGDLPDEDIESAPLPVIPAKAGTQRPHPVASRPLGSRFRGNDNQGRGHPDA